MIGVIPAAGAGKRLGRDVKPLIKLRGKHLIEYPLGNMRKMGIDEAVIIENGDAISRILGSEANGIQLSYVEQTERRGIAHAISLTQPNVGKEDIFIILSDVVYVGDDIRDMKTRFTWKKDGNYALYAIKKVPNQNLIKTSYGFETNSMKILTKIIEKPRKVKHLMPFIGLGIYVADHHLYSYIEKTPVSKLRNEVEITDTLNLLAQDIRVSAHELRGMYANINTPIDLQQTKAYLEGKRN